MSNIETALTYLNPNMPRDEWVTILMAIKSELGDAGYDIAKHWSSHGDSYNPSDFKSTWKSINADGGVTISTLFKMARDQGFEPNRFEPFDKPVKPAKPQVDEQVEIEKRLKQIDNFWQSLRAKHPPQPCDSHPYLVKKQISPPVVNYLPNYKDRFSREHGDNPLILWVMNNNRLAGFQLIYPDGFKRFIAGTVKSGSYYMVTRLNAEQTEKADTVVLCEGFATACSVLEHKYPQAITYIAFDAGNMPKVASYLRRLFPTKTLIVCADNDHTNEKNPGLTYGKQAVLNASTEQAETFLEYPHFDCIGAEYLSDWNDFYTVGGNNE